MKVTRGYGLLEGLLAKKRAWMANSFISPYLRQGRILDIGCGSFPYFLKNTEFAEKYGIDKTVSDMTIEGLKEENIILSNDDIEKEGRIPFDDGYFDVVTMLAVIEHIELERLDGIIGEVCRILKSGGLLIITTPASWTDGLLRFMARIHLVSPVEIEEHKATYTPQNIISILEHAGFAEDRIRTGYFELFMNIWAVAYNT
jgi:SAM-dependent methyltransferase